MHSTPFLPASNLIDAMAQNKLIVKNTIFMYTRMILIMGVTLYASRVVLDKLGVQDFSLYNVVGGIVGMLSFLNGTLEHRNLTLHNL